ncbi:MAG TPA: IclR family transcriptional regulator [Terriglobia bacterium]|nr:IclR family transcriptional regulator [Terriglobia bacterium]
MDKNRDPKSIRRRRPKEGMSAAKANPAGRQYYSKTIGRALDVLECFSDEDSVLSLNEITHLVHVPGPSLFRILLTLESRGYLVRNADGSYRLARKVLLGKLAERSAQLTESIHPELQNLSSRFNETASLAYLIDDRIQVLDTVETFHEIRVANRPGRVLPPHCSALGKAITAFQKLPLAERILEVYGLNRRTPKTLTDRHTLQSEFEHIRAQGFAVDNEESIEGGVCVSAPVSLRNGRVIAAISISTPVVRMNPKRMQEITRAVKEAAALISESLQETSFSGLAKRHENAEELDATVPTDGKVPVDVP